MGDKHTHLWGLIMEFKGLGNMTVTVSSNYNSEYVDITVFRSNIPITRFDMNLGVARELAHFILDVIVDHEKEKFRKISEDTLPKP